LKRSESLAIENVRRIAEQLRSERNDAIALGQVLREDLEMALTLLRELSAANVAMSDAQTARLRSILEKYQ
jgi:hypothetical protein